MSAPLKKSPKGLGRGLDALLGDAGPDSESAPQPASLRARTSLPIEFLKANPNQPRRIFDEAAIDELAASIRARGLIQPILVRPLGGDAYEIVAGERRWRAAQRAPLHEVPVVIRDLSDDAAAEIALIENVQRVDLGPIEEARAYQRLIDIHKRSLDEVAKAVGKSRPHVSNTLRLLALPAPCLEALEKGEITAGHARAMLASPKPEVILAAVREKGLSVREAERYAAAAQELSRREKGEPPRAIAKQAAKPSAGGRKDADTRALEQDLAAALGLNVSIEHSQKGSGLVAIAYESLDQLDEVVRRLMGTRV